MPRQQADSSPHRRNEILGYLFKPGTRLRPSPSKATLAHKHRSERQKSRGPVFYERDNEGPSAEDPQSLSGSDLDDFAYRTSEKSLSHSSPNILTKTLLSLRTENQRLQEKEQELIRTRAELSRLQDQLEDEKKKLADAEKAKKRALRSLAQASSKADSYSYDDPWFERNLRILRWKINHWVRNQKWQISKDQILPEHSKLLKSTTPYHRDYMETIREMEILLEARIWQFFTVSIFGQDLWADGGNDEKEIKDNYSAWFRFTKMIEKHVSLKHVELQNDWRAVTARIMAARDKSFTTRGLQKTLRETWLDLKEDLELFSSNVLDESTDPSEGHKIRLEELIQEAVNLDAVMRQQRAYYQFYPSPMQTTEKGSLKFSSTSMESRTEDNDDDDECLEGLQVKLILHPGLLKKGNSAGKNYGQSCIVLKAVVDVVD